jgi:hypothetical protein
MKHSLAPKQVEPRLVAKALGAFSTDNFDRTDVGLPPVPSKRYIGIIMIGLAPLFYKITITQALVDAVMTCYESTTRFARLERLRISGVRGFAS